MFVKVLGAEEFPLDTVVMGRGLPFVLAFLDHRVDTIVHAWTEWVTSGQLVKAQHSNPERDALVLIRPAAVGAVQFIAHEPAGRQLAARGLYTQPQLLMRPDGADLAPEQSHYWTLQPSGFSAKLTTWEDGTRGILLGNWELGRI